MLSRKSRLVVAVLVFVVVISPGQARKGYLRLGHKSYSFFLRLCHIFLCTCDKFHISFHVEFNVLECWIIMSHSSLLTYENSIDWSLPARASEQGNVIGLVSVYIYIYICDWLWEKGHIRAYFQNRVIGTTG